MPSRKWNLAFDKPEFLNFFGCRMNKSSALLKLLFTNSSFIRILNIQTSHSVVSKKFVIVETLVNDAKFKKLDIFTIWKLMWMTYFGAFIFVILLWRKMLPECSTQIRNTLTISGFNLFCFCYKAFIHPGARAILRKDSTRTTTLSTVKVVT